MGQHSCRPPIWHGLSCSIGPKTHADNYLEMAMRDHFAGACIALALTGLGIVTLSQITPTENALGPLVRIFDSLAPWLLLVSASLSAIAYALRARIAGLVGVLGACLASALLIAAHFSISQPLDTAKSPDLRVLFFNALSGNAASAYQIADQIEAQNPDILFIAEAAAIYPALHRLRARYEILSECSFTECDLVVAVRREVTRFWTLDLNTVWPGRYIVVELPLSSDRSVFVVGNHLAKPWMSGVSESELARLAAQYDWLAHPVIAVGDYNFAPWSKPMRDLLRSTGYKTLRMPIATWPAAIGRFALPIDHALVHNGAVIVSAQAFGADLGSNHLGLVLDVAIP